MTFVCVIAGGKTPDIGSRTYTEIMREQLLRGEETEVSILHALVLSLVVCASSFKYFIVHIPNLSTPFAVLVAQEDFGETEGGNLEGCQ